MTQSPGLTLSRILKCSAWWNDIEQYRVNNAIDSSPSYEDKVNKAVWRGTFTGKHSSVPMGHSVRGKLLQYSLQHPELLDAKLVSPCLDEHCTIEEQRFIESNKLISSHMSIAEMHRFRYQIVVDGNHAPSSRFRNLLLGNSLVIKQDSDLIEFFYEDLKPGEHFIQVDSSLSDLETVLRRLHAEETTAHKRIVERSTEFVQDNLSGKCMLYFWKEMIETYAALQVEFDSTEFMSSLSRVNTRDFHTPIHCF